MALHSRDAVTVSAAVASRSRADCSSMECHTSLSTDLVRTVNVLKLRLTTQTFDLIKPHWTVHNRRSNAKMNLHLDYIDKV